MRSNYWTVLGIVSLSVMLFENCKNGDVSGNDMRFELLDPAKTGVDFTNQLTETPDMNIITYLYFFNGGGVATGDLNGDSLPEIYFTGNQVPNKLYLNRGGFKFEDITEKAGVAGNSGWKTGVTMADVNGDGLLDIYVSQLGQHIKIRGKNQLFINLGADETGVPTFEDQAEQWGLDLVGYSTQAAFLDYDLDGDLDLYMLNHSVHDNETFGRRESFNKQKHPTAGDKFLRNEGNFFKDVTDETGINCSAIGYGLGIAVSDINLDGYPDLYIGNDFHENDYLYLNTGKGSFVEVIERCIGHTSRFSMGVDIADYNNDGLSDLISLDMLPEDPVILKASASEDPLDIFLFKLNYGYSHQYSRNALQLNAGFEMDSSGLQLPHFQEISCQSGIYATDWSWASLFADFDLDGYKDLFISNGIKGRPNDLDYIKFVTNDSIQQRLAAEQEISDKDLFVTKLMPQIKLPNYLFRNKGDLTFENKSKEWGFSAPSFSHGTAYADLDSDGDLDLVVNNTDQPAFIYNNKTVNAKTNQNSNPNYLKIRLEGNGKNKFGVGASVIFESPFGKIRYENYPTKGFQSSVEPVLNIGLGGMKMVDSLTVIWPGGQFEVIKNVKPNQTLIVRQSDATGNFDFKKRQLQDAKTPLFSQIPSPKGLYWKHRENKFIEFNRERLAVLMHSTEGPAVAVGDVNGDGLEDVFFGGAKRQPSILLVQTKSGAFLSTNEALFWADSLTDDVVAQFFDADGDRDLDLLVASGGNEYRVKDPQMQTRLYLNDGKGNFSKNENALSGVSLNASCLAIADFDKDGDSDVFIGASTVPWSYGETPSSYLLTNDGKGNLTNATDKISKDLERIGMVTDALWLDVDGDNELDLVVVGEWMPVTIFLNKNGQLQLMPPAQIGLEKTNGWWTSIAVGDFDKDGDQDFLLGNFGTNSRLSASAQKPVSMYLKDFDTNGSLDQLLCHHYAGEKRLFATKDDLTAQMPFLKKKYLKYTDFAKAKLTEIFPEKELRSATELFCYNFASSYVENLGGGKFSIRPLPMPLQLSVIKDFYVDDLNGDGNLDALTVGNFYEVTPELGRFDANYGTVMLGDGKGNFDVLSQQESGLWIRGQCRSVRPITIGKEPLFLVARNNDTPVLVRKKE